MKNSILLSLTLGIIFLINSCYNPSKKEENFIISKDSVNIYFDCAKRNDSICLTKLKPFALPPPGAEWYHKVVVIFDSTDRVYLYQTKQTFDFDSTRNNNANDKLLKYPPFIGLQTYQLLTFSTENFINFIEDNNDILKLDTIEREYNRFIYIASNKDTIKNKAFYNFMKLIKQKPKLNTSKRDKKVYYIIRMTTEEENHVIYYKRRNKPYFPENIKWSENFINGNCRPLTKEYDSTEKSLYYNIKACEMFFENCTELKPIK